MPPRQDQWRPLELARPNRESAAADAPMDILTSQFFSAIQLQQPCQQSRLSMLREARRCRIRSEGEKAAVQFVNLVRSTVSSVEVHHAFLQLMTDHKRRLSSGGDVNAINLDTLTRVDELFQNYPVLISGFRANFDSIRALFASFALI